MIDALLRILTGRGNAVRTGAWLGLLAGAQVFIGEELLVDTALACLVLAVVLALQRPRAALRRAPGLALGLATSAARRAADLRARAVGAVPRARSESAAGPGWSDQSRLFRGPARHAAVSHAGQRGRRRSLHLWGLPEVLAYLGWPLLVVLAVGHDPLLARPAGPHRGRACSWCWNCAASAAAASRSMSPGSSCRGTGCSGCRPSPRAAGPVRHPRGRRGCAPCSLSRWTWRARGAQAAGRRVADRDPGSRSRRWRSCR